MPSTVEICGDRLAVHFRDFDLNSYETFLKVKSLPETELKFVPADESYTVSAPARFAGLLGADGQLVAKARLPFPFLMEEDQLFITSAALDAKRYACWSDCGNGKTFIGLEFARQVIHMTGGRCLIFTLNDLVQQWIDEAEKFYGTTLPILKLKSREEMRRWAAGEMPDGTPSNGTTPLLAITNYEKMNPDDEGQEVLELRNLAGVILDESDRLKGGGGKQKWALIKSCKGIEYKLSLTATPAPNDTIEYASQASFLEKMRSDADIIWTYFQRDEVSGKWTVKKHAREAFFKFMADWSIYVRNPKNYGWRLDKPDVPPYTTHFHPIEITPEQLDYRSRYLVAKGGQLKFTGDEPANAIQRMKLSQIAKGFVYRKGTNGKFDRLDSYKPDFVAGLIRQEMATGEPSITWTVFDAESQIICERLGALGVKDYRLMTGNTKEKDRIAILRDYKAGNIPALITLASMLGYGQNFQVGGSMIFSGFNDSYVRWYQAIRRMVRNGQLKRVRVHVPYIALLELDMLENVLDKDGRNEAEIAEMEANYIAQFLKRSA